MTQYDPEVMELRARTNCAAVLERLPPPWRLDARESSRGALKIRRGPGEILIVSHEGRGWWDPQSGAKGDCFHLVQYLDPGLNFGQARKLLREFAGLSPSFPPSPRSTTTRSPQTPAEKWEQRPLPRRGSGAWKYLTRQRHIPSRIVFAAARKGAVRDGPYGSAWFAHRGEDGAVTPCRNPQPRFQGLAQGRHQDPVPVPRWNPALDPSRPDGSPDRRAKAPSGNYCCKGVTFGLIV
jgi:hypothetical protein